MMLQHSAISQHLLIISSSTGRLIQQKLPLSVHNIFDWISWLKDEQPRLDQDTTSTCNYFHWSIKLLKKRSMVIDPVGKAQ